MKQYSRRKKLLYSAILVFFSLVLVEASLHFLYAIIKQQPFPIQSYDNAIHRTATLREFFEDDGRLPGGAVDGGNGIIEVIHPYLGFVRDPDKTRNTSYLGFPSKGDDPFRENSNDSITVALFGGSFAEGVSTQGRLRIKSTLQDHGINARILTVAMGGYKQPQQLLALTYLLSQGAHIDVAVNIDGFNEVALPQAENVPKGVNPFYPRAWYNRTLGLHGQVTLRKIGRVLALDDDRRQWAIIFRDMPKFSIIRNTLWRSYDILLEKRVIDITDQIRRSQPLGSSRFLSTGPDLEINEETELWFIRLKRTLIHE